MTCKEKLKLEHPDWDNDVIEEVLCDDCPPDYGYLDTPYNCVLGSSISCAECWNREIPETFEEKLATIPEEEPDEIDKAMIAKMDILDSKTKIIVISGKARHGKDTTAIFLKEALEAKGKKVLITHYGDLVKYVCKTFFDWNGEKDEAGRALLQYLGTDVIRAKTPNYWVQFILSILEHFPDTWDYVLIPDCRFPNEIDCVKNAGWDTTHIRVVRSGNGFVSPLTEEQQNHISETALDNARPDCFVLNYGTLDDLKRYVYEFARYLVKEENP